MRRDTAVTLLSLTVLLGALLAPALPRGADPAEPTRGEQTLLRLGLVLILLLRVLAVFQVAIDTDEPQHLHVVWGWARGLLPYRDLFDNHMPLFHLLCTPLFAALGERPTVLPTMRVAMLPLSGLTLWSTYRLGHRLYSRRVGLWAVVFTGLFPPFFLGTTEFRPDGLWLALWVLALSLFLTGPVTRARSLLIGLLLGTAVGVSLKTLLLLAALGAALLGVLLLSPPLQRACVARQLGQCGPAGLLGLGVVPVAVGLFFALQGAWAPFVYGTVEHNMLPGLGRWHRQPEQWLYFPALLPLLGWGARRLLAQAPGPGVGLRRALLFLAAQVYFWALLSFWPLLQREHFLPFYPVALLLLTPSILALARRLVGRGGRALREYSCLVALVPALVAVVEVGWLLSVQPLWQDATQPETELLTEVLHLTRSSDLIMDLKGETVFRPRPFFYVLERITRERLKRGLIADTIPEQLIATRTAVATGDDERWPPRGRAFLQAHYLAVDHHLRVVGQFLPAGTPAGGCLVRPFAVQLPTQYALVAEYGSVAGWLDGTPYEGARELAAGPHEFRTALPGPVALVWAPAVARGFSPFPRRAGEP